ncbi:MAG TPA: daunorubicin resistance protein DrrC, partial [Verrucomicrobia bacterium]|nr:daunorubicin resistance protein DrrC [Verrucomicrobiota bacterium]
MDNRPDAIQIRGARTHNLAGFDLDLPKNQLIAITGVSGSGKSSLVFDTLHTEAQRQWIETFSSFARRFLPKLSRPDVDDILHLSPSIVIDQAAMGRTLRSTVGTATEVATYLRMLFSRLGEPQIGPSFFFSFNVPAGMCPACQGLGRQIAIDETKLIDPALSLREGAITHPDCKVGGYLWREIANSGLFDVDQKLADYPPQLLDLLLHSEKKQIERETAGVAHHQTFEGIATRLGRYYRNKADEQAPEDERTPYERYLVYRDCPDCGGTRLNPRARSVRLAGRTLVDFCDLELRDLREALAEIHDPVAAPIVRKMRRLLGHLVDTGVGYLSLSRSVASLSGGESQRVKLARQLDCDLSGLLYVLDEPSIGLHPRDTDNLVRILRQLRDKGNTVLVVEHDLDLIQAADHVVEIGPAAGRAGGHLCYSGSLAGLKAADTPTGRALRAGRAAGRRERRPWTEAYEIRGAAVHNLKNIDVSIPKHVLVCVTGVAGSGKSSLIHEVFAKQHPDCVLVDQQSIGRSSRSNPATWLGIFDAIRKEFAAATGAPPALFSFNSKGACPECKGLGFQRIEMNFMDDVRVECPACQGLRYTPEALAFRHCGKNIADILEMTAREAAEFFAHPDVRKKLDLLERVGLGYLHLGQPLSTLSGGECQRLKLALELSRQGRLFILDEPTTGLHPADVDVLMRILDSLVDHGNSVVVIEHNLDVMARADWIIDLGPEGG